MHFFGLGWALPDLTWSWAVSLGHLGGPSGSRGPSPILGFVRRARFNDFAGPAGSSVPWDSYDSLLNNQMIGHVLGPACP